MESAEWCTSAPFGAWDARGGLRCTESDKRSHLERVARASKVADLSLEEFIELLGEHGIPAVDYPAAELERKLDAAASNA